MLHGGGVTAGQVKGNGGGRTQRCEEAHCL